MEEDSWFCSVSLDMEEDSWLFSVSLDMEEDSWFFRSVWIWRRILGFFFISIVIDYVWTRNRLRLVV